MAAGEWISHRGPMNVYQSPDSLVWQLLILGIVGTSAGIRAVFVDGHLLIPALGTAAGLAASWVGWRLVRRIKEMGCRVETPGLRVHNISSEQLIPWDEIQALTFMSSGGSSPVKAHLRAGPPHPIMGLRAAQADERIMELVADLNRELERRTGRTIDPSWHDRKSVRAREATSQPLLSPRITVLLVLIGLVAAPFRVRIHRGGT